MYLNIPDILKKGEGLKLELKTSFNPGNLPEDITIE